MSVEFWIGFLIGVLLGLLSTRMVFFLFSKDQ